MESIKTSKCLLYLKTTFELLKRLPFCCLKQTKNDFETLMNVADPLNSLRNRVESLVSFLPPATIH